VRGSDPIEPDGRAEPHADAAATTLPLDAEATGPLKGVRVIDMTSVLLGPVATLVFADLGADVIKVESPAGDTTRSIGHLRESGMASLFLHTNRNKRSVVLDLKQEAGREALRRLLVTADVLFHNMRPQALAALGFDYASVRAINPRIVYCGAFGYGQGGRYAARPAYDDLIQSAVAMPSLFERTTGRASYVPVAMIDRMVALTAAYSVCAALYHRERTGEGQAIEVPMFETMAQVVLGEHLGGATFDPPAGPMGYSRLLSPFRKPYRTQDGYVAAMAYTDRHWQRFFAFIEREELATDPRFVSLETRTRNIDALYQIAEAEYAKRTTAEWVAILERLDIPGTAVHTLESLVDDPHLDDVGFFRWVDHPTQGRIRVLAQGTRWSETPPNIRRLAPRLGENSREILRELGYGDEAIDALAESGATRLGTTDAIAPSTAADGGTTAPRP
jgi:crotonobetainyl-CoA:carnitine CoA-transferase CaiB-like acyl-CoA transferase